MIVGTAGHVDHGKSTVVRLITGTDPDRWAEEHRRGLTIGLGFGFTDLSVDATAGALHDVRVAVVDVPGHGRFLPTMLQGAHAVDVAMLIVAAHEGWMPQTAEHVAVLEALGTRRGVVVITHVDKVSDARVTELLDDLRERLAGTFLGCAIVDPVSTVRLDARGALDADGGTGVASDARSAGVVALQDLRSALRKALADAAADPPRGAVAGGGRPRVWVDRAFNIRGVGRVATGTLTGGDLAVGDSVDVVHREDGVRGATTGAARNATIASMHVHGQRAERVSRGQRVGIRLGGRATAPSVGDALVRGEQWASGRHLHAAVRTFDPATALRRSGGYELMVGTARWSVELRSSPKVPGPLLSRPHSRSDALLEWQPVRIHATAPVGPVAPGDRFVLVDSGTSRAVAGGVLLAVDPVVVRRAEASLQRRLDAVLPADEAELAKAMLDEDGPVLALGDVLAALGRLPDRLQHDASTGLVYERVAVECCVDRLGRLLGEHQHDPGSASGVAVEGDPLTRFAAGQLVADGRAVLREGLLWSDDSSHRCARSNMDRAVSTLAGSQLWRRAELVAAAVDAGLASSAVSQALRSGALIELCAWEETPSNGGADSRSGGARVVSAEALGSWQRLVVARLGESPARLGELRDLLALSRSETLLVLEHLDACGVTRRQGDERVLTVAIGGAD